MEAETGCPLSTPILATFACCCAWVKDTEVRAKPTSKTKMAFLPIPAPVYCGSLPVVQSVFHCSEFGHTASAMVATAPVLPAGYVVSASRIADRRITLGGYRLADLLTRLIQN